ncbi:MAG TPA: phosphoenolpyruvate synthase [Roseiflexaceae bacterium]|nr:phosphoenolpyruvate synthase [Roseiflexaceae bacterium]
MQWVRWFSDIGIDDVPSVGGKNASLGEMLRELASLGVQVPDGYAVTADAYRLFLAANGLEARIRDVLAGWTRGDVQDLTRRARHIRNLILKGSFPDPLAQEIIAAYRELSRRSGVEDVDVAVRSSATAEDLPTASFAGQQETYLHVHGEAELLESIKKALASLFTARAISYREDMGFDHFKVALSVGVQRMVEADDASSGVIFTLDTESGFRDVVFITAIWGLGENIVQGRVAPDEFYVHKPTLRQGYRPIIWKRCGAKEFKLVYDRNDHRLKNLAVLPADRARFALSDDDVLQLARWSLAIEEHYSRKRGADTPMDIEWAKDSRTGQLFIVQARPETVHGQKRGATLRLYQLSERGPVLVEGLAVGDAIAVGPARVIRDPRQMGEFQAGEVLITEITNPDWEPIMKQARAIVTERGGRTSHAAIVARELGIPAIVGAAGAMRAVAAGQEITVSCAEGEVGHVYAGALAYTVEEVDPATLPRTRTQLMMNVGNPEQAFKLAQIPNDGVGLARMEFIFASWVRVHPLALTRYEQLPASVQHEVDRLTAGYADKTEYFVDTLARGIGTIAAAFWPKPVILRLSDFKTNEYAHLLGGAQFEPDEENPMLGWRGASRYYHPGYQDGFMLEVAAIRRVREVFGLKNLVVMVPFCRTPEEGRRVLEVMRTGGLERGVDGLEVYVMAEIPSNILMAAEFAEVFDGFSIGSNDLTQLTLGVDRDSERVAPLFDERSSAVTRSCAELIAAAHRAGRKVGICGQAPSDYPEFAAFLVAQGIDSISLSPDAVVRTRLRVHSVEQA